MTTNDDPGKKDVMLDIETLATDGNALVLSIGAIKFDLVGRDGPWFGEQFFVVPSLIEQILLGRTIERGTQEFWATQPTEAQAHWANAQAQNAMTVYAALADLGQFVRGAPRIWANGAVFDFGILESLLRQVRLPIPWKYNTVRDARTVYDVMTPVREFSRTALGTVEGLIEYPLHHPIRDCEVQIIRLWERGDLT